MAKVSFRRRIDTGRLIMVPTAALLLLYDVAGLMHRSDQPGVSAVEWLGAALVCAFYALIIWSYLRRGPAVATSRSKSAHAAAVLATLSPFVIPLLRGARPGSGEQLAADLLLVSGLAWSVWSLRFLARNLSVIAQAREVVDAGPYRWVRHPLYTGEIVSSLGLALIASSAAALGAWLALCGLQVYRAVREEQVLLHALPDYRSYRSRTAALVPGLF